MKRATRNAAKTRQEIIEKSAPIFNVHGYAGTKMQMLVDATGYQMGGIYRHFETKMDLAKAAFQHNYENLVKPNLDLNPQLNPKEKLLTIIENYKKMVIKPRIAGGCPILNTATEVDDTDEDFRKLTKLYVEEILAILEAILEEGKAMNIFQSSVNSKKEAQYIFATFEGAIMLGTITKDMEPVFDIFERTRAYLEDKIFKTPHTPKAISQTVS